MEDEIRFAVVSLYNHTDITIEFLFRWGNSEKESFSLEPGGSEPFPYPLDSNGAAPYFEITIHEELGNAPPVVRVIVLPWRGAPDAQIEFGQMYAIQRDTSDSDYVTVWYIGPPDVARG